MGNASSHLLERAMGAVRAPEWMGQRFVRVTVNVARGTLRGSSSKGVWLVEEPMCGRWRVRLRLKRRVVR